VSSYGIDADTSQTRFPPEIGEDPSHYMQVARVRSDSPALSLLHKNDGAWKGLLPCLVGIEACDTAYHWASEIRALGHKVRRVLRR
jgi:hypothetical protein